MKNDILIGAGLWFASMRLTRDITVAYIGVPLNVLVACVLGAWASLSFGDKIESRGRAAQLFTAAIIMGAAFTAMANAALVHWLGLAMTDGLQAGIGVAVSFVTPHFLPWLVDMVRNGKWLDLIPFLRRNKQ